MRPPVRLTSHAPLLLDDAVLAAELGLRLSMLRCNVPVPFALRILYC